MRVEHLPVMLTPDQGERDRPADQGDQATPSFPTVRIRELLDNGLMTPDGIRPDPF